MHDLLTLQVNRKLMAAVALFILCFGCICIPSSVSLAFAQYESTFLFPSAARGRQAHLDFQSSFNYLIPETKHESFLILNMRPVADEARSCAGAPTSAFLFLFPATRTCPWQPQPTLVSHCVQHLTPEHACNMQGLRPQKTRMKSNWAVSVACERIACVLR